MKTVLAAIQQRSDTAANWASLNPILLSGELGVETDTQKIKVGDGVSHWLSLMYVNALMDGVTLTGVLTDDELRASPVPVSGPLTDTQLRATAVPVSVASLPTSLTAGGNLKVAIQEGGNAGGATEAKQDTQIVAIGGVTETVPATDIASSGLNGRLQRIAQRLTSLIGLLPTSLTASGNLKVAVVENSGSGLTNAELRASAVPVSGPLTDAQLRSTAVPVSMTALPTLAAGTNNIGDVDVLSLPAIPAGSNTIGATKPAALTAKGYQQISSLSAAATLTVPSGSTCAIIQAESKDIRWRDDGTNPTASAGMVLAAGAEVFYTGNLATFAAIETAASAKLNISYYG